MSEEWLAGFLGISEEHLRAIEEGRARIGFEDMQLVADLIGVTERYFYQGYGKEAPPPGGPVVKSSWVRDVDRWFRDKVAPHERAFLSIARGITGNLETARDLVHDAYAAVLTGDRWRSAHNPRAFVRKTITNLALNSLRHQKVVPMDHFTGDEDRALVDDAPDAYQAMAQREELDLVLAAIEKLPRQCRVIFIMKHIDDLSPQEIAAQLGIAVKTVSSQLSQGLQALHHHLEATSKSDGGNVYLAARGSTKEVPPAARERKR
jgi:RNA polymerase sigma-70 factor (ECF subfamily)